MSEKTLVIVESPTKAKTISKFLDSHYTVLACMGHIRDLPASSSEIPEKYKKESWSRLGINVENQFQPLYVVPASKQKIIKQIKEQLKLSSKLLLATDEDREGESISWHLLELLKPTIPTKRMVFHEITQQAINQALKNTREVDMNLVHAQETRRFLDRLYGYSLSPLLWKKIQFGLSAGRVQSPGLRLLCQKEQQRMLFHSAQYFSIEGTFQLPQLKEPIQATLVEYEQQNVAQSKDFDELTGKIAKDVIHIQEKNLTQIMDNIKKQDFQFIEQKNKTSQQSPPPPFITSSLQQQANRSLNLSAKQTMSIAQKLYEKGFITYMRTDSPQLSSQAIKASRKAVEKKFGKQALSAKEQQYTSKSKVAQEAHEAIRPSGEQFMAPESLALQESEKSLYALIYYRTLACQMKAATKLSCQLIFRSDQSTFIAQQSLVLDPGFLQAYGVVAQNPIWQNLPQNQNTPLKDLQSQQHQTSPPHRYTEASLVQTLEKLNIGRPSTYASIISTLVTRGYVLKKGNTLIPTIKGLSVNNLLSKEFQDLLEYTFTSVMEEDLDDIANGEKLWQNYLKQFYQGKNGLEQKVKEKEQQIPASNYSIVKMPQLKQDWEIHVGKTNPYIMKLDSKGEKHYYRLPSEGPSEWSDQLLENLSQDKKWIGKQSDSGYDVYYKQGPYGPLLELIHDEQSIKTVKIPPHLSEDDFDQEKIDLFLQLPVILGKNPQTKKEISTHIGPYGPYLRHGTQFFPLSSEKEVFQLTLTEALKMIEEKKLNPNLLKTLGEDPQEKQPIQLIKGRFGPYLQWNGNNIALKGFLEKNSIEQLNEQNAWEWISTHIGKNKKSSKKTSPQTKKKSLAKAPKAIAKIAKKTTRKKA